MSKGTTVRYLVREVTPGGRETVMTRYKDKSKVSRRNQYEVVRSVTYPAGNGYREVLGTY